MTFQTLIKAAGGLVADIVLVLIIVALLVFFWGLVKFIAKAGDEKAVEEGRNLMVWGVISLFVMITVWGLVNFIGGELGIGQRSSIPLRR